MWGVKFWRNWMEMRLAFISLDAFSPDTIQAREGGNYFAERLD